jgi:hypothetical protein
MKSLRILVLGAALLLTFPAAPQAPAPAPLADEHRVETEVARGLTYTHIRRHSPQGEPWSIHVLEMDRRERSLALRAVAGTGEEEEMQRALPSALGKAAGALAVVNGDYDLPQPYFGISDGLSVTSSRLWTTGQPARPVMAVLASGEPVIAVPEIRIELKSGGKSGGKAINIGAVNKPFGSPHGPEPRIFTREFRAALQSEAPFHAVVIGGLRPVLPLGVDSVVRGVVERVVDAAQELPLGRNSLVVAQRDAPLELKPGDTVELRIEVRIAGRRGVRDAIGGFPILVQGGQPKMEGTPGEYLARRHPRTAACYNAGKIIFVVVDGRQPQLSVGMTLEELAGLMVSLGCAVAMNTDGGGSSVMAARIDDNAEGAASSLKIVNSPSDGQERGRGNAWVILRRR